MENDFLNLIESRRSIRKYQSKQISDEELEAITKAGTFAPSAEGAQDAFIVVVQNKELKDQIKRMNANVRGYKFDPFYGAPTYILVFATNGGKNALQDGSCVLMNMMFAAHAIGLSSCWINREVEMFATEEGKQLMKELDLPDGLMGVGALAIGYADGDTSKHRPLPRKKDYVKIFK